MIAREERVPRSLRRFAVPIGIALLAYVILVPLTSTDTAQQALRIFEEDQQKLRGQGRGAGSLLRVHDHFRRHPTSTTARASADTGLAFQTIATAISEVTTGTK